MAGGIFISYRRDDARQAAGRLADDLADHVGGDHIFRDIEGIELGVDFAQALNQALEACVLMLVLIGPKWLAITDAQGRRRLDDPRDWIRLEIATALKRGIRVVPLLLDGTPLPAEDDLPEDLKPLVRRQALEMADSRWRGDLQRLTETLARVPGLRLERPAPRAVPPAPAPGGSRRSLWVGMAVGAVGLLAIVVNLSQHSGGEEPSPGPGQSPAPSPAVAPAPAPSATPSPAVAAPAPGPATAPVAAPVTAPPLADLSGQWRTLDGEVYQFRQQGRQISFIAQAGGINVGSGQGEFDGAVLRLSMALAVNGVPLGMAQCQLQASPDVQRFVGMCQGANGPFQAQIFR